MLLTSPCQNVHQNITVLHKQNRLSSRYVIMFLLFTSIILPQTETLSEKIYSRYEHTAGEDFAEKNLIKSLLTDYDKTARPIVDGKSSVIKTNTGYVQQVTIEFGLELYQILDLNEMDQVLTTSVRSLFRWKDYFLTWEPRDRSNLTSVKIPSREIWLPDISLYNYADERMSERKDCDVTVHHDGTVEWYPLSIYKSNCFVNITYFPFDQQHCSMKFGPWSYDGHRVNISHFDGKSMLLLDNFVESSEWKVMANVSKFNSIKYTCCPEIYVDITYSILLKRQPAFYRYILILPCFLLSSLTLVLFWLPPETPAKIVLGMNIFVAFFLLLLLLKDITPSAASNFPLLGVYYCFNMGIITLSAFLSCIIVNLHFRSDNQAKLPTIVKIVMFKYVANFLLIRSIGNYESVFFNETKLSSTETRHENSQKMPTNFKNVKIELNTNENRLRKLQSDRKRFNAFNEKPIRQSERGPINPQSVESKIISNLYTELPIANCDLCKPFVNETFTEHDDPGKTFCTICNPGISTQQASSLYNQACWCENLILPASYHTYTNYNQLAAMASLGGQRMPMNANQCKPCYCSLCLENTKKTDDINSIIVDVKAICDSLSFIRKIFDDKVKTNQVIEEWRDLGTVLDRIFFIFYLIAVTTSIMVFSLKSSDDQTNF